MQVAVGYRQRNDGFGLLPNNELRDFESHAGSIPVGLTQHRLTPGHKVLRGEGCVDSFVHRMFPPVLHEVHEPVIIFPGILLAKIDEQKLLIHLLSV